MNVNAYTVTFCFDLWSGILLDTTVLARNEFQAERLAHEKIWSKHHNFMVWHGIDDIVIRSIKLVAENINRGVIVP